MPGGARTWENAALESHWKSLPKVDEAGIWIEAGRLSTSRRLHARGVGLVEAAILAVASRTGAEIWTLDRRLRDAAGR
jgi:predicted nucleic acid-binding protein